MYDLIIVGGGPGGVAAGIYAARKKIKVAIVTDSFGGQSLVSSDVQNWIGTKSISGLELAQALEEHLRAQDGIDIFDGDLVATVTARSEGGFALTTRNGKTLEARFLLIVTGSRRRKLGIPGEKELDGKGVVYCSTCDAPLFKDKRVVVVGGGNAGLEAVIDSLPYASEVYLLEFKDQLKGDPVTQEKVKASSKVQVILQAQALQVLGDKFVSGLKYKDLKTNEEKTLAVDGIFVEIGAVPNSDLVKGLVELNQINEIIADPRTQRTSNPGIWAVGDVSDVLYKQNNISVGDAIKAVLSIYDQIHKGERAAM